MGEGETLEMAIDNHDKRLNALLKRCEDKGIVLNNNEKFCLRQTELPFMGHVFTDAGLKPDQSKIISIVDMPVPSDVPAVRRFLGMVTYLSKFVPRLTDLCEPLRRLIRRDAEWCWTDDCDQAVKNIKDSIAQAATLKYFNPAKECTLQTDASSAGLGAVLMQDGEPVAYASRTLSSAERKLLSNRKRTSRCSLRGARF